MSFRLNQCDRRILATVADYRVIGTNQLATILERNAHALRRRLRALVEHGFITTTSGDLTGRRGRPEQLMALGNAGIELLKTEETIDPQIPDEYLSAPLIRCLGHQLMVNEFRLQLLLMERAMP